VDLDSESTTVQQVVGSYISELVAAGAGGVRVDAAKHIKAGSLGQILANGPSGLYNFQEVIYGDGEAVEPEEYTGNGEVRE
jgi:alpha-amylase